MNSRDTVHIESIPASIAITDKAGTILFCNQHLAEMFGHDSATLLQGKPVTDLIAKKDKNRVSQGIGETFGGGISSAIECLAQRKDTSTFGIEMTGQLMVSNDAGQGAGILVIRDISQRIESESKIRESESMYRALFENTGTALLIIKEDMTIALANTGFERLSGNTKNEIEGRKRWTSYVLGEDRETVLRYHQDLRRNPASIRAYVPRTFESRFIDRDGQVHTCLTTMALIPTTTDSIVSILDITVRKSAEDALRQSENNLNAIIDTAPVPQFIIDKNHRVIRWNQALERLTGVKARAVLGTDRHWSAFYPQRRFCIADFIVEGMPDRIAVNYAGKYQKSDEVPDQYEVTDFFPHVGESGRWLTFTSMAIRDSQGTITGAIETLVDISGQKQAQAEISRANEQLTATLQELQSTGEMLKQNISELEEVKKEIERSEARYRDIATNIPGIIFRFIVLKADRAHDPFTCEQDFSLFTLGPDEIHSKPDALFNLIHEEDVASVKNSLLGCAKANEPWNTAFRMKPRGNETRWFNGRAVPREIGDGDVIWHGVLIDITDRKIAELALIENERKLRAILDQTFQFMGLLSPDGTLVSANRAATDLIGMKEPEVIGKPFWETPWWAHSVELQDRLREGIMKVAQGQSDRFEATHPGIDGSTHFVDFSLKPVKDNRGNVVFLIPEGHDITRQKLLQEEISAALREKELLLKEIHHRVKNNIQVIASLLNMQARTVADNGTREVLREAQNRVKSIALVHEKLYQSRSLDHIDYFDYLKKISRHLYESYGVSAKTVTVNIQAENISLHIDKAVPCSLIINELLSNAFKHAFPDGRKGDIWITIQKKGESLVLLYRDNGIGLPENISPERAESLGMRRLHGLTRQLHGTIEISGLEGTSITITFPYESRTEGSA